VRPVPPLTREKAERVLMTFLGEQTQIPPMFSAVKYRGRPLYEYGRRGIEVPRKGRRIEVSEIRLTRFSPPLLEIAATLDRLDRASQSGGGDAIGGGDEFGEDDEVGGKRGKELRGMWKDDVNNWTTANAWPKTDRFGRCFLFTYRKWVWNFAYTLCY
jgi:hypothetical protein